MIGQKTLQGQFNQLIAENRLPRFIMLSGAVGSGRKTLAVWLSNKANMPYVISESGVSNIREIIEQSYTVTMPTVYIIPDANKLTGIAQNTLLKVTEEPPNDAYFIMTVESTEQVLNTLVNRSTVFNMSAYTADELSAYIEQKYQGQQADLILQVADSPGEIDQLYAVPPEEFHSFVVNVVDNIAVASGTNAFKILQLIDAKEYPLNLALKAFSRECMNRIKGSDKSDRIKYAKGVTITHKYLPELQISGINRDMLFDSWLLDIRKAWL